MKALLQIILRCLFLLVCNGCNKEITSYKNKNIPADTNTTNHTLSVPLVRDGNMWRYKKIDVVVSNDTHETFSEREVQRLLSVHACSNAWIVAEMFTRKKYGSIGFVKDKENHTARSEILLSELLQTHHSEIE